jgi:hypothetical protein
MPCRPSSGLPMLTAAMAAAIRNSGAADTGEWWDQVTLPRKASAAASSRPPKIEIMPRPTARASRARVALTWRDRGVTYLTVPCHGS